jgi:hypothetical protein
MGSPVAGIAVVGHNTGGEVRVMCTNGHAGPFRTLTAALEYCDRYGWQVLDRETIEVKAKAEQAGLKGF